MDTRSALADGALDYVLTHGIIGLSLRPLAKALGTSDRMLIYHFGSKDGLLDAIFDHAQMHLASASPPALPVTNLEELVIAIWQTVSGPEGAAVTRLYLEASVLAVQEPQRWGDAVARLRAPWRTPLRAGLVAFGIPAPDADAMVDFVLCSLDGLALDKLTSGEAARCNEAALMLARLVSASASKR